MEVYSWENHLWMVHFPANHVWLPEGKPSEYYINLQYMACKHHPQILGPGKKMMSGWVVPESHIWIQTSPKQTGAKKPFPETNGSPPKQRIAQSPRGSLQTWTNSYTTLKQWGYHTKYYLKSSHQTKCGDNFMSDATQEFSKRLVCFPTKRIRQVTLQKQKELLSLRVQLPRDRHWNHGGAGW